VSASSTSTSRVVPGAPSASSSTAHVGRFPPLAPGFRQPPRQTPWTSSLAGGSGSTVSTVSATAVVATATATVHAPAISMSPKKKGKGAVRQPPMLSDAAFPELPTTAQPRMKPLVSGNASLRHILGDATPASVKPSWRAIASMSGHGAGAGSEVGASVQTQTQTHVQTQTRVVEQEASEVGRGRKGKGKQKQTLFTLGSFPT
jgi:hypothetical protein